jgi:outer membrane protein assembly factor BamB
MREDFVTQLKLQLRDAAEREAHRGPVRRAAHALRWDARPVLIAAAAAAVVAALALVAIPFLRNDATEPAGRDLRVVAHVPLVERGSWVQAAFGAVWAVDPGANEIVRVDPRSREVDAHVAVGGEASMSAGEDAIWAVAGGRLLEIDPQRATVTRTLDLGLDPRDGFPIPVQGAVWVMDAFKLRRVDTATMTVDRDVRIARGSFLPVGMAQGRDVIYIQRSDGVLTTYDARTGDRIRTTRLQRPGGIVWPVAGALLFASDEGVSAVDPRSGAVQWTRNLGTSHVNGARVDDPTAWVQGSDATSGRDRLWRIDARDGRVLGTVTLPDFGVGGMAVVGNSVWIVGPSGKLTVVAP